MLFNSLAFCAFFPLVTAAYFLLPHRMRWGWLLLASCYFYMSFVPAYILILAATIAVDYVAALKIEQTAGHSRRLWFGASVASTIAILFVFKYFNFANENVAALAHAIGWNYSVGALRIALPIGLSFHTFQSLAYVIEVYRGEQKAERHFGIYALYVMFYPQLVAGPIERPQNLLHQFREEHRFDPDAAITGLKRMGFGLFKKVVIADRLGRYVDDVYGHIGSYTALPTLIAVLAFTVEIYCDFSGYSDIAVGTAKVMGFTLMENFERPFLSQSVAEFWRRWHRSLSTWFNDYVFTPMYLRLRGWGEAGLALSLMVTFFLSGVWHGAGWNFVIFGCLHGAALVWEVLTRRRRAAFAKKIGSRIYAPLARASMFGYVAFCFIFFRASSLSQAVAVISTILRHQAPHGWAELKAGVGPTSLALSVASIGVLASAYRWSPEKRFDGDLSWWGTVALAAVFVLVVLHFGGTSSFIYFQF